MWRVDTPQRLKTTAGVIGLGGVVAIAGVSALLGRGTAVEVPTTLVVKGEFIDYLQVRGEVRAARAVPLTVPTTAASIR
jgi:hypothetical protein